MYIQSNYYDFSQTVYLSSMFPSRLFAFCTNVCSCQNYSYMAISIYSTRLLCQYKNIIKWYCTMSEMFKWCFCCLFGVCDVLLSLHGKYCTPLSENDSKQNVGLSSSSVFVWTHWWHKTKKCDFSGTVNSNCFKVLEYMHEQK